MILSDTFPGATLGEIVFLRKYAIPKANRIHYGIVLAFERLKSEVNLDSFRGRSGLETEPLASFCLHGPEVPDEPGARNSEQASRLSLVAPRALIDRPDMPPHDIG